MKDVPQYLISFRDKIHLPSDSPIYKLDKEGVILYKIPYTPRFDYYPVNIAQYALGNYEMFLETKEEKYKENFLRNARWLLENMSVKDGAGVWLHNYTLPYGYNFKVPWIHGMGQSLAISTFIRAYNITGNEKYKEAAKKALRVFELPIEEGGVRYVDSHNNIWYEEYGVIPPVHILNGFMYILIGLHEVKTYLESSDAEKMFEEGLKTLIVNLSEYDSGYWSLYDLLHKYPATPTYHSLHIAQLEVMYSITHNKIFKEVAERWDSYQKSKTNVLKAKITRNSIHFKKLGIVGGIIRWMKMREYFKK